MPSMLPRGRRPVLRPLLLAFLGFVLASSRNGCLAIRFDVVATSKCLGEDIPEGTLVVGSYKMVHSRFHDENNLMAARLISPSGKILHEKQRVREGEWGFTTRESGHFMLCLWLPTGKPGTHTTEVDMDWRTGVAAKDWGTIAKKQQLDGMQLQLLRVEASVRAIREEMSYFRAKEAEMRDLNERTNERVAWLSITSLFVCIGLAALQLWLLKVFFARKKLI